MAFIKCPECEKPVSDEAKTCPHCGFNIKEFQKQRRPFGLGCGGFIVVFILIFAIFSNSKKDEKSPSSQHSTRSYSSSTEIKKSDYKDFQSIILAQGFRCDSSDGGRIVSDEGDGKTFKVYCNDNSYVYRVLIAHGGYPIVSKW